MQSPLSEEKVKCWYVWVENVPFEIWLMSVEIWIMHSEHNVILLIVQSGGDEKALYGCVDAEGNVS